MVRRISCRINCVDLTYLMSTALVESPFGLLGIRQSIDNTSYTGIAGQSNMYHRECLVVEHGTPDKFEM